MAIYPEVVTEFRRIEEHRTVSPHKDSLKPKLALEEIASRDIDLRLLAKIVPTDVHGLRAALAYHSRYFNEDGYDSLPKNRATDAAALVMYHELQERKIGFRRIGEKRFKNIKTYLQRKGYIDSNGRIL